MSLLSNPLVLQGAALWPRLAEYEEDDTIINRSGACHFECNGDSFLSPGRDTGDGPLPSNRSNQDIYMDLRGWLDVRNRHMCFNLRVGQQRLLQRE